MKKLYVATLLLFAFAFCKAQYVTIPDTAFVRWLNNNGYSSCMKSDSLDTLCTVVLNAKKIYLINYKIRNLTGIQYFKSLDTLIDNDGYLVKPYPEFPPTITYLDVSLMLDSILSLPPDLAYLNCYYSAYIQSLPSTLTTLIVGDGSAQLPATLPAGLLNLYLDDVVPDAALQQNALLHLPAGLQTLGLSLDDTVPFNIPSSVVNLYFDENFFYNIPSPLPSSLQFLYLFDNQDFTSIPTLPSTTKILYINNQAKIKTLPAFPPAMDSLYCSGTPITSIPTLPSTMRGIYCLNDSLKSLPALPAGLTNLTFWGNEITSVPALPSTLTLLDCNYNPGLNCLPVLPTGLKNLSTTGTNIQCVPNDPNSVSALPLCINHNPNNCTAGIPANYVLIPDTAFANWLNSSYGFPSCMSGNYMDTLCAGVLSATRVWVPIFGNIVDLTGIQYFKNIDTLICAVNKVTNIPRVANTLTYLDCSQNKLSSLPPLAATHLTYFWCYGNKITTMPALPSTVQIMDCSSNLLSSLPALPISLLNLWVGGNNISSIPALPGSLSYLDVSDNSNISCLPELPAIMVDLFTGGTNIQCVPNNPNNVSTLPLCISHNPNNCTFPIPNNYVLIPDTNFVNWLDANGFSGCMSGQYMDTLCSTVLNAKSLNIGPGLDISDLTGIKYFKGLDSISITGNTVSSITAFPPSLIYLSCFNNLISTLSNLPASLTTLICDENYMKSLPPLPPNLSYLSCEEEGLNPSTLSSLPTLPSTLKYLYCDLNIISSLPALPSGLIYIDCSANLLTSLPTLPTSLNFLDCANNNLTSLPVLPSGLQQLQCYSNAGLLCLPVLPSGLFGLSTSWTAIECIPNIPSQITTTLPLCSISNPNGCSFPGEKDNYVLIPDANFVTWLKDNGFASCMKVDSLDTTCVAVLNATGITCSSANISNLTGIRYFKSLDTLICMSNNLTALPVLPATLIYLECSYNKITHLPELPNLLDLFCDGNQLTSLAYLPATLLDLGCSQNQLGTLPTLPILLQGLNCGQDMLTSLPALPSSLGGLVCTNNLLTGLPTLPTNLGYLYCDANSLTSLPSLPSTLYALVCDDNFNLACLPQLPSGLNLLNTSNTEIECVPNNPNSVSTLPLCSVSNPNGCSYASSADNYVLIPDTAFANWLNNNGYSSCMKGDSIDTTCNKVKTATSLVIINAYNINTLAGIQYFKGLDTLYIEGGGLTQFGQLLPSHLTILNCYKNHITSLPTLPSTLVNLNCSWNLLTTLPSLPANLSILDCSNNNITGLPVLPTNAFQQLNCSTNSLTSLPTLPSTLTSLNCDINNLTSLPALPSALQSLSCEVNNFFSLPSLPSSLVDLDCSNNSLSTLPALPSGLQTLLCSSDHLTTLPVLSSTILSLDCSSNQLTSLPTLPASLNTLNCSSNASLNCLPTLPSALYHFSTSGTNIQCVPNNPNGVSALPLCSAHNPNGCTYTSADNYVLIPDTAFVRWLNTHGYASCMKTDSLDTTCTAVLNARKVDCSGYTGGGGSIINLQGIQYFKALDTLNCNHNFISDSLPHLPSTLTYLDFGYNQITTLRALPSALTYLNTQYNYNFTGFPSPLPPLNYLICSSNKITALPSLPSTLYYLDCNTNSIASLPALPASLNHLDCDGNLLTSLPALPGSLTYLDCSDNSITSLPALPATLNYLGATGDKLTGVPSLPSSLTTIYLDGNNISSLPALPDSLNYLDISQNLNLSCLPVIKKVSTFYFTNTDIKCVPVYGTVGFSQPVITTLPLCANSNPNGCTYATSADNYVLIPDTAFVRWLNTHGYSSCMKTDSLDTTCTAVLSATNIDCNGLTGGGKNITNLQGIQYFRNLDSLQCEDDKITFIPAISAPLTLFYISGNQLTSLPEIPSTVIIMYCDGNPLGVLPPLPATLTQMDCSFDNLTSLPTLPPDMIYLVVGGNTSLTSLPTLPSTLQYLDCAEATSLTCLPTLPSSLTTLFTNATGIECVPNNPHNVSALPLCSGALATVSVTPSANNICAGTSVTFTAHAALAGTSPTYQWKKNGSNVASGVNDSIYTNNALANNDVITCSISGTLCGDAQNVTSTGITMVVNTSVTPSVSIINNTGNTICPGSVVTFTATPTNGGAAPSYQWKVNSSNAGSNNATFKDSTLANGNTVSCTMTSNASCASPSGANSNTITMTVNSSVTPTISITNNTGNTICSGTVVTFTATPTNGGATPSYQWKVNGNNAGSNSATFKDSTFANGNTVSCTMTSNASCASPSGANSNTITMTVNSIVIPSLSISTNTGDTICSGTPVTFTASPTNGGTTPSYQWKQNGANAGTNSNTFTTGNILNGNTFDCILTSNASCASPANATSNTLTITVNATVTPSISISNNTSNTICSGTTVTFTATPTNGGTSPSYQWKVNGSNAGSNSATFKDSTLANGAVISCMLTSNATCASPATATSNSITMTVGTTVAPSVTIAANTGTTICSGATVTFTATPTGGGASPSYQWKVNGGNAGSNSATFKDSTLNNTDQVTCVLTSNASCASPTTANSNTLTITVTSSVTPSVSISVSPGSTICNAATATFTATPTNGGSSPSYQWLVNGHNVGTNSSTYSNSTLANGGVVSCMLTSNASCASPTTATSSGITMSVLAYVAPSLSIIAEGGTTDCAGTAVTFAVESQINAGTSPFYQWKKNGVDVGPNSNIYADNSPSNGEIITCTLTSDYMCVSPDTATSNAVTLSVGTVTPSVSISNNTGNTICSGTTVTFTPTPTNGGASPSYYWRKNGKGVDSTSATYTTSTLANGDVITCILTSSANCASPLQALSNALTMTVNANVTPSVSIANNTGNTICTGSSVIFTATPTNGGSTPSYQWKKNGNNVGANSNTYTDAALANNDAITCTMTSNATCASPTTANSNTLTMTVTSSVTPSVNIGNNTGNTICSGTTVTFTATPTNGGASPSYYWRKNGKGVDSTSATYITNSLSNNDVITCILTSSANCASPLQALSNTITMTVNAIVTPSVTISASPGNNITTGTNVIFTATPVNGGSTPSYQWKLNGNNAGTNSYTYSNAALSNGDQVTVILTSDAACVSTITANGNTINMTVTAATGCATVTGGNSLPAYAVVCSGSTANLSLVGASGGTLQWQSSSDNGTWTNIAGATSGTLTTAAISSRQYFRCLTIAPGCFTISSTTSEVDVNVTPTVTVTGVSATSVTVTYSPFSSGQYNVSWTGTAGSGSANAVTTNTYTINGLASNSNIAITVTPTGSCGGVSATTVSTQTLCGLPTINVTATAYRGFKVTWSAVSGATSYRVYYLNLGTANAWSFVDTTGTSKTVNVSYGGSAYAVYVVALNCPSTGNMGEPSAIAYITTNPLPTCTPTPVITASSNCPNQITINILSASSPCYVTFRRISPSYSSGASYAVSGPVVNVTLGTQYSGSIWEVYAYSICGSTISAISNVAYVTVKPECSSIGNLLLSGVNCHGFTATWNSDNCVGLGNASYRLLIKKNGATNFNPYYAGTSNYLVVNWLAGNVSYDVKVISVSCDGATSIGSVEDTIAIPVCREELADEQDSAIISSDNESLVIYPNPAEYQFTIDIGRKDNSAFEAKFELLNQLGQVVQTDINTLSQGHLMQIINVNKNMPAGVYFVRTTVGNNVYVNKIMLQQ